jgi:ectoine hydroxylase-related dioxygenase (phytanoyl-CoA dioxygenase family)
MKYNNFYTKGFQIFNNVLSAQDIVFFKQKIENVHNLQKKHFTELELKSIGESNTIRSPFIYDTDFIKLFYNEFVDNLIKDILGDYYILSLQNAIKIPSGHEHHQSFYHRDLIYQNFVSSTPLSINIYYCLDDYNNNSGGTTFIPFSHKSEMIPEYYSEETPDAAAGSMILFDSMVFHKAGRNVTDSNRIGINNMFTLPFIKQQIKYSTVLDKTKDKKLNRILGFESREFLSVKEFRDYRLERIKNEK